MQDGGDMTIGEVGRNVEHLRETVDRVAKDLTELKISDGVQSAKVDRLERIVYGALGTAAAALVTAIIAAVVAASRPVAG